MIMNNENEKVSRNAKRRGQPIADLDRRMKPRLKKFKQAKKKKDVVKIEKIEIKLVKMKNALKPGKL